MDDGDTELCSIQTKNHADCIQDDARSQGLLCVIEIDSFVVVAVRRPISDQRSAAEKTELNP